MSTASILLKIIDYNNGFDVLSVCYQGSQSGEDLLLTCSFMIQPF